MEDTGSREEQKQFGNIMYTNKQAIIRWVSDNHKSGYDSKPLAILWPLFKRADIMKKTRKRGMNSISLNQILPTKRRSSIPIEDVQTKCKNLEAKNKKLIARIRILKQLLTENNIDATDTDFTDGEETSSSRSDARVEACDTEYLNRHKYLLVAQKHGAVKQCSVDLIKRSLTLQLDGNLNASQVEYVFKDFVNNLGLFPHGDGYTKEFFRSHRELCGYINEHVLAERLKEGSQFVLYLDGSPSGKGKNLLSFGFFDENCDSWNIGIDQFEYLRSSTVAKSVEEGNFILERIKNICERHELDFNEVAKKIVAVISDNAPAAEACRKHIIRRLDDIAELDHKRFSLGCAVHWVIDFFLFCSFNFYLDRSFGEICT